MFGRKQTRTKTLEQYADTVEGILEALRIEQSELPTEKGFGWRFRRGSAMIEIYISEEKGRGYLQVISPILIMPENGLLALYRRLLEYNLQLTNASLGVFEDVIYVFNERPLQGLDAEEADTIITMVSGYADDLDDELVREFGGRLYSQI